MTTTRAIIAQTGKAAIAYTLEFRTWNGAAYEWTDYTDRLVDFSGIGSTIEQNAFPNAFRMSIGNIELDNTDGKFDNLDVLDGKLYNAAEPYGKGIYKRMVRITDVRDNESKVIGVGLVRDVKPSSHKRSVILETISLDARAADQMCDSVTAERHPLGGTDKTAPATWTISNPASATDNVNMYRWREEEAEDNQLYYGWFKDRHYGEIIERTAWALDDLATDITKSYRLMTADGREIATTRNVPPDDPAISTGVTPERCRALVWNPARNVLVCCIGHLIYDYDPLTNVYTQRNVLTPGRDVQRAFYTTEADTNGKNQRIVLVQCDMTAYPFGGGGSRVTTAWITVLDASGAGAYVPLCGEISLGADVFPGTHNCREGDYTTDAYAAYLGYYATGVQAGENGFVQFRSYVDSVASAPTARLHKSDPGTLIFSELTTTPIVGAIPLKLDRGYFATAFQPKVPIGLMYPSGSMFSCSLNIYTAGGRLYYHTWDSTNKYRLNYYDLFSYAAGSYLALGGAATHVPYFLYSPPEATYKKRLYCCQMEWKEVIGAGDVYSIGHVYYYDLSAPGWTEITFISGATGNNKAWMITELVHRSTAGVLNIDAIWFNRETRMYRCSPTLANTFNEVSFFTNFANGVKDQPNRLEGLHKRESHDIGYEEVYFVEAGSNFLWSILTVLGWVVLRRANKTPLDPGTPINLVGAGDPINTDRGLGSMIVSTQGNYPDNHSPKGILFWMSAFDYIDVGTDHPNGRYVLNQYANYDPGFIELLDLSGLSFWELRTLLAERFGFVHYYAPDGALTFKPRVTSGAAQFAFCSDNRNLISGAVQTRGFEAIINNVTIYPYAAMSEDRSSEIIKGYNEASLGMDGKLIDYSVSAAPGENSQWELRFVSATTYDLYKLQGTNFSLTVAKTTTPQSINTILRSPTDGLYLTINPENFRGVFVREDKFTFWVLEPQESLTKLDDRDKVWIEDVTSRDANKRVAKTFENRYIPKQIAPDYAANILAWRKDRHDVVQIETVSDPNYLPLLRCTLKDENMGYAGTETFQIMGVQHRKLQPSSLVLVKV